MKILRISECSEQIIALLFNYFVAKAIAGVTADRAPSVPDVVGMIYTVVHSNMMPNEKKDSSTWQVRCATGLVDRTSKNFRLSASTFLDTYYFGLFHFLTVQVQLHAFRASARRELGFLLRFGQ